MPHRFKAVITDLIRDELTPERGILSDIADVVALDAYSEDDLIGKIEDADALMVYHHFAITEKTISRLEKCRVLARCGVGVDNVDLAAARQAGIPVTNVPDYGTEEVADSAIGMTLALARGIYAANSRLRSDEGPWTYARCDRLVRLRGEFFGIVGLGRIGTAVAIRAKALGMNVLFFDPYISDGHDKALGVRRVESLDELLEKSLVVSLHCPATLETRHLIDRERLNLMRPGSYLVNTARGTIVDSAALAEALASSRLAGAGIDVLEREPPEDDPLIHAWRDPRHPAYHRAIINPHSAFYCEEGLIEMRTKGAQSCRRALLGQPLRNVVNQMD